LTAIQLKEGKGKENRGSGVRSLFTEDFWQKMILINRKIQEEEEKN